MIKTSEKEKNEAIILLINKVKNQAIKQNNSKYFKKWASKIINYICLINPNSILISEIEKITE